MVGGFIYRFSLGVGDTTTPISRLGLTFTTLDEVTVSSDKVFAVTAVSVDICSSVSDS